MPLGRFPWDGLGDGGSHGTGASTSPERWLLGPCPWGSHSPRLSQPSRATGLGGAACFLHDTGVTAAFISEPRLYNASSGFPPSVRLAWLLVTAFFVGSFIYLFIFNQEWLYRWQRNSPGCGDGAQGLSLAWILAPAKCTQRPAAARHRHRHTEGNPHWLFDRWGPGLVFGADPGTEMTHLPGFPSPGAMEGAFVSQEGPDCWGAAWHRCRNPACPGTSQ